MSDDVIDLSLHPRLRWRRGALLGATMAIPGVIRPRKRSISLVSQWFRLPMNKGRTFKKSI